MGKPMSSTVFRQLCPVLLGGLLSACASTLPKALTQLSNWRHLQLVPLLQPVEGIRFLILPGSPMKEKLPAVPKLLV
jgi:hypothetical protein